MKFFTFRYIVMAMCRAAYRGLLMLVGLIVISPIPGQLSDEWPPITRGLWHIRAKRTLANGKEQRWERTFKRCEDPTVLFKGYWGKAPLDKAGCRFEAKKTASNVYQVSSECMLLGGGKSIGLTTVTVAGEKQFQLAVRVTENQRDSSAFEEGELVAGCPKE